MARNRKNQSATVRFGPALKAVVLCVVIGGSGLGYVWQKSQIAELWRQLTLRESKLRELDNQNTKLRDQLAVLQSPAKLNLLVQELNLGLARPQPNQVWPLPEPAVMPSPTLNASSKTVTSSAETGLVMH